VAASFKYNGDGTLVAKLVGTVATYYIGGVYEVEVTNTTPTKKTWYYPAGGATRTGTHRWGSVRVEDLVNSANSGVFYILKDHLGSASVTLDSSGSSIAEARYYPFGETRFSTGTIPTDQRFQGQREVSGLGGLMQFGARFYLPRIGRFASADSIVPNFANPQSLNRYAFVLNNPLKYIDPTGHTSACANSAIADPECGYLTQSSSSGSGSNSSNSGGGSQPIPDAGVDNAPAPLPIGGTLDAGLAMQPGCGCGGSGVITTPATIPVTATPTTTPTPEANLALPPGCTTIIQVGCAPYTPTPTRPPTDILIWTFEGDRKQFYWTTTRKDYRGWGGAGAAYEVDIYGWATTDGQYRMDISQQYDAYRNTVTATLMVTYDNGSEGSFGLGQFSGAGGGIANVYTDNSVVGFNIRLDMKMWDPNSAFLPTDYPLYYR
jgi:RHS repeat-associated protein